MKKIISIILTLILISSCSFGKKDNTLEDDKVDDGKIINTTIDTNEDNGYNTNITEDNLVNEDETGTTDEINTIEDTSSGNIENTDNTTMSADDKLVEEAINEIDKIISEIEADVK